MYLFDSVYFPLPKKRLQITLRVVLESVKFERETVRNQNNDILKLFNGLVQICFIVTNVTNNVSN